MHIPMDFDKKEFYEFIWMYERLAEQRHKENEQMQKDSNGGHMQLGPSGPSTRGFNAPR